MKILDHIKQTRSDVTWIKGPDESGDYFWDTGLVNQSEIAALVSSFDPNAPEIANPNHLRIYDFITDTGFDKGVPPQAIDFVTGTTIKLHRKSTVVKGECQKEEYYSAYDGVTYTDIVVEEISTFNRDALGFPVSRSTAISWYKNSGTKHDTTKSWLKYYSNLEKIQEGKTRRGNLLSNLQMPCIGLISIAMIGHTDATPEVILEGRRFLGTYSKQFTVFVDDSNKEMLDCLSDPLHPNYVSAEVFTWIDSMTPYGITIRQFIINEMTI